MFPHSIPLPTPHLAEFLDGHLETSFPVRKDAALQVCLVLTLAPGILQRFRRGFIPKKKNIQFTHTQASFPAISTTVSPAMRWTAVAVDNPLKEQPLRLSTTNHQHPRPSSIRTQWLISSMEWRKAFLGSSKTTRRIWKVQKWKDL